MRGSATKYLHEAQPSQQPELFMEIGKKPWPILSVCGFNNRIDTNPDFQRPAVWSLGQKQLLVDTILRGYDIPKLYWRKVSKIPEKYEVVDGQQRLRTILSFTPASLIWPRTRMTLTVSS